MVNILYKIDKSLINFNKLKCKMFFKIKTMKNIKVFFLNIKI